MTDRGAGCWESRLSGSERGRVATRTTGGIMWHRRETKRPTENTNFALPSGKCPVYSKPPSALYDPVGAVSISKRGMGSFRQSVHALRVPQSGSGFVGYSELNAMIDFG